MMRRWLLAAALLGGSTGMTNRAEAGLILDLRPSQGADLSNLQIGQSFAVDLFGLGDTPGEALDPSWIYKISYGISGASVSDTGVQFSPTSTNDLSTKPLLLTIFLRADAAGTGSISTGFSNLTTSNGTVYNNLESNVLDLNVVPAAAAVPEPSTFAGAGVGIALAVGALLKRRRKVSIA